MVDREVEVRYYRHFKGGTYIVEAVRPDWSNSRTHLPEDERIMVQYRKFGTNDVGLRTRAEFHEMVEHGGRLVPRFRPAYE